MMKINKKVVYDKIIELIEYLYHHQIVGQLQKLYKQ